MLMGSAAIPLWKLARWCLLNQDNGDPLWVETEITHCAKSPHVGRMVDDKKKISRQKKKKKKKKQRQHTPKESP